MIETIPTIISTLVLFVILLMSIWRFSLLIRAIVAAYQNDKKIDKDEFVEIYHQTLSYFKWLLSIFGIDVDKLLSDIEKTEIKT